MTQQDLIFPDGITSADIAAPDHARRPLAFLPVAVLALILSLALAGLFGGGRAARKSVRTDAAVLSVTTPDVMRNGVSFETRIAITARRGIGDLVLAVPGGLWRDMTINAQMPQARDEKAEDGEFRFSYGRLKPGDTADIKIDGQVNPSLVAGTSGTIRALDGKTELAALPLSLKVLP